MTTVPLPHYAKIKDNYCIAYFGNSDEYLVQLKLLRPFMEKTFPGVQVYLACKDEAFSWLAGSERCYNQTSFEKERLNFAYVRELTCNLRSGIHPVEEFLKESDVPCGPLSQPQEKWQSRQCVLLTKGCSPTQSLSEQLIKTNCNLIHRRGFQVQVDAEITTETGWVVGVESAALFQAAADGIKTTLIRTGIGENLFKSMFPWCHVVEKQLVVS